MRCEVLAIGTELLLGQIVDTNSAWIGEQFAASGIDSYEHRVIGDNQARIVEALRDLLSRSDAVLVCGGLGPTQDDLTRDAIAELMGVPLERAHGSGRAHRIDVPRARARHAAEQLAPGRHPGGRRGNPESVGTAPGLICPVGDKIDLRGARRAVRDAGDGARARHPRPPGAARARRRQSCRVR